MLMMNSMRTEAKSVLLKQSMFIVSAEQEHTSGACSIAVQQLCHQQKDDLATATTCSNSANSAAWQC